MPSHPIQPLPGTMCQHDFIGQRLFQHRNLKKFRFFGANESIPDFRYEADCFAYLDQLRAIWDGKINGRREQYSNRGYHFRAQSADEAIFNSVVDVNEYRLPSDLSRAGTIVDIGAHIGSFTEACLLRGARRVISFEPHLENFELAGFNLRDRAGVQLTHAAVLHASRWVEVSAFHFREPLQNTGGVEVTVTESGNVPAISLDEILRNEKEVELVKLDCEGSEWPILLHGTEWSRSKAVCGEYHERQSHPLCPGATSGLTGEVLWACLRQHFEHVRIDPDQAPGMGKFWASQTEDYFVNADQNLRTA